MVNQKYRTPGDRLTLVRRLVMPPLDGLDYQQRLIAGEYCRKVLLAAPTMTHHFVAMSYVVDSLYHHKEVEDEQITRLLGLTIDAVARENLI